MQFVQYSQINILAALWLEFSFQGYTDRKILIFNTQMAYQPKFYKRKKSVLNIMKNELLIDNEAKILHLFYKIINKDIKIKIELVL